MTTTQTPHERVAAEIRAELARKQIPQSRLAAVLGISEVGVSRRMRGETPLDINELVKIAGFLGVPVSQFMPEIAA
jgi:transcriptional regulator with XRE-family HTH domain